MLMRAIAFGAALGGIGACASAQVSTFTNAGGGPVLIAPKSERPASRAYLGRTHVNAHQDIAPGVADALAPASSSRRSRPMEYGASPTLADLTIPTNIGPTVVYIDPWTMIDGRGNLKTLEAARVDFLERYGLVGSVRTHSNDAALILERLPATEGPERARPAPADGPAREIVRADQS
jgi:hypothetical protein